MRRPPIAAVLLLGWMIWTAAALTDTGAILIKARTIYTVTQGMIENGEILVAQGKIQEVGRSVTHPEGATVYDAVAVMPGMIDAHAHLALRRGDRGAARSGPVTAEWKAVEHLNLEDPMLQVALAGGVTSVITRSGSGIVSSGQAVALKIKRTPEVLKPYVDLKMAVRPLIKLRPGEAPATVMGWFPVADDHFRRAKIYLREQADFKAGKTNVRPPVDERLEAFAAVLRGDVMVHAHTHYPSENQMVMHLARKYGFIDRLAFGHAEEVAPMSHVLTGTKIVPVVGPMMIVRYYGDSASHNIVKELMEAGVSASIQTDNSRQQFKDFREYGAFLVRHGLREEHALQAITVNGAKAMMLDKRIGSIEPGKDADLVLLDGHPFDLTADRIERVIVDGVVEYERAEVLQTARPTAVGPFQRYRGEVPADARAFALTNAHVFTVSGPPIPNATVVVDDGRFTKVEAGGAVPAGLPALDVGGRAIVPGWVVGRAFPNDWIGDLKWQVQNDEALAPIEPEMNARFAVDPWFPSYDVNREIGIVSQNVTPGHRTFIGGTGVIVKSVGMNIDRMVRKEPSSMVFSLTAETGRQWSKDPAAPMSLAARSRMIRDALDAARQYTSVGEESRDFNAQHNALRPVLRGEVPAVIHARRVDEIREAIALAADYTLRLIISGGTEAHQIAGEIAKAGAPVILGNSETYSSDLRGEGEGYSLQGPAILARAGVKVAFFGDGASRRAMPSGRLGGDPALNAAWAFRNGAPEADALKMVTLNPAEMFGMADRIGSIAPGKDADFLVLEGHPFDYNVLPQMVYIDGRRVHAGAAAAAPRVTTQAEQTMLTGWAVWFGGGLAVGALLTFVAGRRRRARAGEPDRAPVV